MLFSWVVVILAFLLPHSTRRYFLMSDIIKEEKVLFSASIAHRDLPRKSTVPGLDSVDIFMSTRKMSSYKSMRCLNAYLCDDRHARR
jgi:hypothetical protein